MCLALCALQIAQEVNQVHEVMQDLDHLVIEQGETVGALLWTVCCSVALLCSLFLLLLVHHALPHQIVSRRT